MIFKSLIVWLVIAAAETLHGMARVRLLNRRLGDRRARQVTVVTGSAIVVSLSTLMIPWIGLVTLGESLLVGLIWLFLMLAFDIGVGRLVFRFPWRRILADFDLRKGGYLGIGMLVLLFSPLIAAKWHGIF